MTLSQLYSGVTLSVNTPPATISDFVTLTTPKYQQFALPQDYARVGAIPAITGLQILVGVGAQDISLGIRLEHKSFFGTWETLAEGFAQPATVVDDEVWLTALAESPIDVSQMTNDLFRFRFESFDGLTTKLWYTAVNPDAPNNQAQDNLAAQIIIGGNKVSFLYRLLSATADSGIDFLGNGYRSLAISQTAEQSTPTSDRDTYWLSGPQPSKFAVVSQYFDVQTDADATVIDRILIDPVTPGMWVHAYYCNDGDPGTSDEDWEERLWNPIPGSYHALRRDVFVLRAPVQARFIKLEYSHLQARHYAPGGFQRPLSYKKHPKWVLDYFLLAVADRTDANQFVARSVSVSYNAYDLAFRYYQDDLVGSVDPPPFLTAADQASVTTFLTTRDDRSDQIDATTRSQISLILNRYAQDPRAATVARTLLGDVVAFGGDITRSPIEIAADTSAVSEFVSHPDRDAVVFELDFPVMFFFLQCRHRYREVSATLPHDRAYFAGVREVAFTRERYNVASDLPVYVETLGDHVNSERNNFFLPPVPVLPGAPVPPAPVLPVIVLS